MANMTLIATPNSSRKKLWIGAALIVVAIFSAFKIAAAMLTNYARRTLVESVRELVPGEVTVGNVSLSLFPQVHISGDKLEVRRGDRSLPPYLSVPRFSIDAGLFGVLEHPRHLGTIHLENVRMEVPPKDERTHEEPVSSSSTSTVDTVIAENSVLELLPKERGGEAHDFQLYRIVLHAPHAGRPIDFSATIKIPTPPSEIEASGKFGPVHRGEIGVTPVSGTYRMRDSDLSKVKGIMGTLSSDGRFSGELDRVEVEGAVDSPDFATKHARHRFRLAAQFQAQVDGLNADTKLESVRARFLHSSVTASGSISGTPGVPGKKVTLDLETQNARLADLLALVIQAAKPPVSGVVSARAKFELPQGKGGILERIKVTGSVGVGAGKLTVPAAQAKINELSAKAEAEPQEGAREDVLSSLRGNFNMSGGVAHFPVLTFSTPGADAELHGTWTAESEALNFNGTLHMAAKISQTQTGVKSFFLKVVDPFFKSKRADKGSAVPVKVSGTLEHPDVAVSLKP